jgi:hypothetical protein
MPEERLIMRVPNADAPPPQYKRLKLLAFTKKCVLLSKETPLTKNAYWFKSI